MVVNLVAGSSRCRVTDLRWTSSRGSVLLRAPAWAACAAYFGEDPNPLAIRDPYGRQRETLKRCRWQVLEHIENEANRAAILRSVEALGLLHVHEVDTRGQNPRNQRSRKKAVGIDCEKWLVVHKHESVDECVSELRGSGFLLCAAVAPIEAASSAGDVLGDEARAARRGAAVVTLGELNFAEPVALVFGNERLGVTEQMRTACDIAFTIPMQGLSESFNVSVATALALHWGRVAREAVLRRSLSLESAEPVGDLSEAERRDLELRYRSQLEPASQSQAGVVLRPQNGAYDLSTTHDNGTVDSA